MNNMTQYRYPGNKPTGNKIAKLAIQLGIVLILMLLIMLFKYTKSSLGVAINNGIHTVFNMDYTPIAKETFNSFPAFISKYINKENIPSETKSEAASTNTFTIEHFPINGEITSPFGERINPITKAKENHTGIDISAAEGTEVKNVFDGVVVETKEDENLGIVVIIDHENNYKSYYGHLSELKVIKGDRISKDTVIGLSGNTGKSTGPHLHFELRNNDKSIDPTTCLKAISD